jgi:hypothetical protein
MLGVPAQQVTLDVGQRIDVHMTEEGSGPHGNKLVRLCRCLPARVRLC